MSPISPPISQRLGLQLSALTLKEIPSRVARSCYRASGDEMR